MPENLFNWAGNHQYRAARLHYPETVGAVQELVRASPKLRALGTRHSFNDIADTTGDLVSLAHLNRPVGLDAAGGTVTVEAGIRYGDLAEYLHREGYALPNLASLPHISVAGACATATHGSGVENGNLATAVTAMELVTADGALVVVSRQAQPEQFDGMVVHLGGLGIVTRLTLALVPAFAIQQEVYDNLPLAELRAHFDDIVGSAYSVSLLTDWQADRVNMVWLKRWVRSEAAAAVAPTFFGATRADAERHPIAHMSPENCTPQMGIPGPWHERLPHFRMRFTPSSGEELQSEYFVPRAEAGAALDAVARLREPLASLLQISEVRTVAADALWMSPCYQQPSVALHFTWIKDWDAVRSFLPVLETQLAPFHARPHWGKLFTLSPQYLQSLYARLPAFRELLRAYDPTGKFRNAFLEKYIFAPV